MILNYHMEIWNRNLAPFHQTWISSAPSLSSQCHGVSVDLPVIASLVATGGWQK